MGKVCMSTSSLALAIVQNAPIIRQSALYQILASTQQTCLALLINPHPPSSIYQQEAAYSMRGTTIAVYSYLIYLVVMPYIDPAMPDRHTSWPVNRLMTQSRYAFLESWLSKMTPKYQAFIVSWIVYILPFFNQSTKGRFLFSSDIFFFGGIKYISSYFYSTNTKAC